MFVFSVYSVFKVSDDVIACNLWFGPPNQKFWLRLCLNHLDSEYRSIFALTFSRGLIRSHTNGFRINMGLGQM